MNQDNTASEFWSRADSFIDLANEQTQKFDDGKVSASFLYAAARYNAFVSASKTKDQNELIGLKESFTEYMLEQYRKALEENIDDYITNYDQYIPK